MTNNIKMEDIKVGTTITINSFTNKFGTREEKKMVVIEINKKPTPFIDFMFIFDNGMKLSDTSLLNNFDLWNQRAGFLIEY